MYLHKTQIYLLPTDKKVSETHFKNRVRFFETKLKLKWASFNLLLLILVKYIDQLKKKMYLIALMCFQGFQKGGGN